MDAALTSVIAALPALGDSWESQQEFYSCAGQRSTADVCYFPPF